MEAGQLTGGASLEWVTLEAVATSALSTVVTIDAFGISSTGIILTWVPTLLVNTSLCGGAVIVTATTRN